MKWAALLIFEGLCAVEDLLRLSVSVWLLAAGVAVGAAWTVLEGWRQGTDGWMLALRLASGMAPGLLLLFTGWISGGKVGAGDGWMVLAAGLFSGWEWCLSALTAAGLLAACFAGIGMAMKKVRRDSRICFAPFLFASTALLTLLTAWG